MLDIAICDDDNSFAGGLEKTLCRMEKTYGLNRCVSGWLQSGKRGYEWKTL